MDYNEYESANYKVYLTLVTNEGSWIMVQIKRQQTSYAEAT